MRDPGGVRQQQRFDWQGPQARTDHDDSAFGRWRPAIAALSEVVMENENRRSELVQIGGGWMAGLACAQMTAPRTV